MKVTIEFDLEIDGELDEKRAADIFFENIGVHGLLSEDIEGTDKWAILVNSWELKEVKDGKP